MHDADVQTGPRLNTRVMFSLYDSLGAELEAGSTNLYFIGGHNWVKVGLARDVKARLANLQCACPFKLTVLHVEPIPRAFSRQVEARTHDRLRAFAAHGEWFDVEVETAKEAARDVIRQVHALMTVLTAQDGKWAGNPAVRHTGADFIYLMGGIDAAPARLLPY